MPLNSQLLAELYFEVAAPGPFKDSDTLPNLES